jgi:hypothetical protein
LGIYIPLSLPLASFLFLFGWRLSLGDFGAALEAILEQDVDQATWDSSLLLLLPRQD